MKSSLVLASVLMLLVCSGCGDSPESVAEDSIGVMEEMVGIMESVKDEASAKKANEKLRALGTKFKDLKARQDKLQLTEAQKKDIETKYKAKMEPVAQKFFAEMMRVGMDPKLAPALQGLDNVMD